MEIKVRTQEVIEALAAIHKLKIIPMKGVYGLAVARLQKKIDAEAATIYDSRSEILKKHGERVTPAEGETMPMGQEKYTVKKENAEAFEKDFNEMNDAEITISCDPLPPGITDEVECAPEIWSGLLPFLKVEIDQKPEDEGDD